MEKNNRDYREIILTEAKNIALKDGITRINIRAVAKNSGIAIGTVYNYFPSKGDLLIAVIEDFWEDAFREVDWKAFALCNFYDNLEKIYNILYLYINKFKENWLEQIALLNSQEKLLGRQKQNEYFNKICNNIKTLIDNNKELSNYQWSETISKEKMASFIFENMLIMLRKDEKDISFFIEILKKIISN